MDSRIIELSQYRFQRAQEDFETAEANLKDGRLKASRMREKSDYQDFFIVAREDTDSQLKDAKYILNKIESYLNSEWEKTHS